MHHIYWPILTVIGSLAGGYFGAYLKTKAENLATHEDIKLLVDQVKAVTTATKEIEEKISDDFWIKQRRWEMKRDVLMQIAEKLNTWETAFTKVETIANVARRAPMGEKFEMQMRDAMDEWDAASLELDRLFIPASIACGTEVVSAIRMFFVELRQVAIGMYEKPHLDHGNHAPMIAHDHQLVTNAIRKELGIEEWT